jgi:hypothetical protein
VSVFLRTVVARAGQKSGRFFQCAALRYDACLEFHPASSCKKPAVTIPARDQEGWSRRIIEFTGLEWDERCLSFHETERRVGTASNWQVRQKIYKTSKERWRNYERHVGPLLPLLELE